MKKQFLTTCAIAAISLLTANVSYGQNTFPATGNAGIGTTTPAHELTVNGNIGYEPNGSSHRSLFGNSDHGLQILSNTNFTNGSGILLGSINGPTWDKGTILFVGNPPVSSDPAFRFTDGGWNNHMTIDGNSDVKIVGGLEIGRDYSFSPISANRHIYGNTDGALAILSKDDWSNSSGIIFNGIGTNTTVDLISNASGANAAFRLVDQNWTPKMTIDGDGNTEIGGNYSFVAASHNRFINGNTDASLAIFSNTGANNGSGILLNAYKPNDPINPVIGDMAFVATQGNAIDAAFSYWTADNTSGLWTKKLMELKKDGQVVIGDINTVPYTNNNPTYKLYVQTGILTEKIKVATVNGGNWSDFVFADNYELKSLNDVQNFIVQNKHLPDVPSACDVEENGYDLTKMDATLLQKIEELTLYIIQQQKEIDELKKSLNK